MIRNIHPQAAAGDNYRQVQNSTPGLSKLSICNLLFFLIIAMYLSPVLAAVPGQEPVFASPALPLEKQQVFPPIPGDSLYQLPITLTDHHGKPFKLSDMRGKAVIISMFYHSCEFVCPMLIETMHITEQSLTTQEKTNLSLLLLTFDPERDSVAILSKIVSEHQLDPARWTLARTDDASVRQLAAALNIQYRHMDNGEFNHTSVLILLDKNGRISGRSGELGQADPEFIQRVKLAVQDN